MRIHNVFDVSLLQQWKHRFGGSAPTQVLLVKDDEQFEIDSILNHQDEGSGKRRNMSYLVSWKGYSSENNSLEPESNLKISSAYRTTGRGRSSQLELLGQPGLMMILHNTPQITSHHTFAIENVYNLANSVVMTSPSSLLGLFFELMPPLCGFPPIE